MEDVQQPWLLGNVTRLILSIDTNETHYAGFYFETGDKKGWRIKHGPRIPDPLGEKLSRKLARDPVIQRVVLGRSWESNYARHKYTEVSIGGGVTVESLLPASPYRTLTNNGKHHILLVLSRLLKLGAITADDYRALCDKVAPLLEEAKALLLRKWPLFLAYASQKGVRIAPGSMAQVDNPQWRHSALAAEFMG